MHTCLAIPGRTDFYLGTSLLSSVIERELKTRFDGAIGYEVMCNQLFLHGLILKDLLVVNSTQLQGCLQPLPST